MFNEKNDRRKIDDDRRKPDSERRNSDIVIPENKLVAEIQILREEFIKTTEKLIRDVKRQDKIMVRSDKRQQKEYDQLQLQFKQVEFLNKEIEETQREIIFTMGAIGEARSKETGNHVRRVAEYSKLLALFYGLAPSDAELLKQASPMHDIGKIAIPDSILNKPGKLTSEERVIMDTHAGLGYEMLRHSTRPLLKIAATVANEHHEKWDGSGYPNGLSGENIHIYGRITALADVFDALGCDRVYKKAWDDKKIFNLFREERGKHFDPKLVDIFFDNLDDFLEIREKLKDVVN